MENRFRILYAEDDKRTAEITQIILELEGFKMDLAFDGKEAWTKYHESRPDLLLLDLDLPEKTGQELIRLVREQDRHIPIVLYTSYASPVNALKAIRAGANDFIDKNDDPELFIAKLKGICERMTSTGRKPHVYKLSERMMFNSVSNVLTINGNPEVLKPMEGLCLKLLCVKLNEVAEKSYLLTGLFGIDDVRKENDLRRYISHLRKRLATDASVVIDNRRNGGYCLHCKEENENLRNGIS